MFKNRPFDDNFMSRGGFSNFRVKRGMLPMAILYLLQTEGPKTIYEIRKDFDKKTEGIWVPSIGAISPAIKKLCREHLISTQKNTKSTKYLITKFGINKIKIMTKLQTTLQNKNLFFQMFTSDYRQNNTDKNSINFTQMLEIRKIIKESLRLTHKIYHQENNSKTEKLTEEIKKFHKFLTELEKDK